MRIFAATGMCFALLCAMAFGSTSAGASTPIAPSDGAKFAGGATTKFSWNWPDASNPWEGRVVYSQEPNPTGPGWFDVNQLIQLPRTAETSLFVQFDSHFTKGKWYWRMCNFQIDASDDLCHYTDRNVRSFTMTSTAIRDLTVPVAKRLVARAIKKRGSNVSVKNCSGTERNVVICVGKWRSRGKNYTALGCKVTRNLKTSRTRVKISSVRSDSR